MSKIVLTTISDDRFGRKNGLYRAVQQKIEGLFKGNSRIAFDEFDMWTWGMMQQTVFYKNNQKLLSNPDAGMNGRVYKPFVILNALERLEDGDFVVYTDCSPEMWNIQEPMATFSLSPLKELCASNNDMLSAFVKWDAKPIMAGQLGLHIHKYFTLDICMNKMNLRQYENSYMHASGMFVIRKSKQTLEFMQEWLYWNCDEDCSTLLHWESEKENKIGHRHDQSISGLLINADNRNLVDILHNEMNPYNFLQYCRTGVDYKFINSNTPVADTRLDFKKVFIRPQSKVRNEKGTILNVYKVELIDGVENFIVGQHEESCYATTRDKITLI